MAFFAYQDGNYGRPISTMAGQMTCYRVVPPLRYSLAKASIIIITRMLAINVSIPKLTVARARLEQFRSPQLPIHREPPSDVGVDEVEPSFIRKPHVVISRQSPFAANVVPKLVAMATSLRPSISAMSSLDSLTPKTYPSNQTVSR